ncbi:MAG: glycoside hydrolase family 43 protein [Pseudomonadota bacterium]
MSARNSNHIRNPFLKGFNPDPCICRVGDTYYVATSTFEWYPGVQIHASKDLQQWEMVSRPLNRADLLDMRGVPDSCGVWAPGLSYADGEFWLVYTNVRRFDGDFKDTPNFLTTCDTIDGDWGAPVYLNASGFDPSLFHDDDGRKWLVNMIWDHRADRTHFGGIYLQEYDVEARRLTGPRTNIFKGSPSGFTEAPHLYKVNGYYYLMTAEGGTGYDHAVTIARSKDIQGPYELDPARHILTAKDSPRSDLQRTGHASLVQTQDGDWLMPFLCSRPLDGTQRSPLGRESALARVHLDHDGWFKLRDTDFLSAPIVRGNDGVQTYQFDSDRLHQDFQWLRTPHPERLFSLEDRPGHLRLMGRESPGSLFEQSLIARRASSHAYEVMTSVEFDPEDFQQMAGLMIYYNQHKFHYLNVSRGEGGRRELSILSCLADQSLVSDQPLIDAPIALPETGSISLRARVTGAELRFAYAIEATHWIDVGPVLDASLLSDEAGKGEGANFTGTFVGMGCHDLTGQGQPADFSHFEYRDLSDHRVGEPAADQLEDVLT